MPLSSPVFDICVLIPCYNNLAGLKKSLQSIVFDKGKILILVVDDGSEITISETGISSDISFKVKVINLEKNTGITHALNTGLQWITENTNTKYIARLDCNDICHPERFNKQAVFLETNPAVGLLGTWCKFASSDGNLQYDYITPISHQAILKEMPFRNVFIHPTIMFRSSLLSVVDTYPSSFPHAEDYAFCMELIKHTQAAVLPQVLVICEVNPHGISHKNRLLQLKSRYKVVSAYCTPGWRKALGLIKLKLLMLVPYKLILKLK